jgi:hypothetical protein
MFKQHVLADVEVRRHADNLPFGDWLSGESKAKEKKKKLCLYQRSFVISVRGHALDVSAMTKKRT